MANDLIFQIGATSTSFKEESDRVKKKLADLDDQLSTIARRSGLAFAAIGAGLGYAAREYEIQQVATQRLTQALQNQGIYSDKLLKNYIDTAEVIQAKTGIDNAEVEEAQALIQAIIGQTEVTPKLTEAIINLSSVRKEDLRITTELIGRGIQGHARALQSLGINIDQTASKQERMTAIIEALTQRFGGQAEAANKGLGEIRGLKTEFDNFAKVVGEQLEPVLSQVIHSMTEFFREIQKHEEIVKFVTVIGVAAATVTGLVAAIATAGTAVIAFEATLSGLAVVAGVALPPLGLIVAALAAIGVGAGLYVTHTKEAALSTEDLEKKVTSLRAKIAGLQKLLAHPQANTHIFFVKDEIESATKELAKYETQLKSVQKASVGKDAKGQNIALKKAADEAAQIERDKNRRLEDAKRAHLEVMRLEDENGSAEEIRLAQEQASNLDKIAIDKNKSEVSSLRKRNQDLRTLQIEEHQISRQQQDKFFNSDLANDAKFRKLSLAEQHKFLLKYRKDLQGEIHTEQVARELAAKKSLKDKIDSDNLYLDNQIKFGKAYATIYQVMHSEIYEGTKSAFADLADLQQSSNATLKSIGKVAAIANIVIHTAESAMNIFTGFSTIPIVGYALGIAGAAAAVAFGAEQIGKVNSANRGGIVPGVGADRDSVLSFLTPGEFVVPRNNYDEVVNAVARDRAGAVESPSNGGSGSDSYGPQILATLQAIHEKVGSPEYHLHGDFVDSPEFISRQIDGFSRAIKYGNKKLFTKPAGSKQTG